MFVIVDTVLSAPLATNGTVTLNYPTGRTAGDFRPMGHRVFARGLMAELPLNTGYTLTFNAPNITFTYKGATTIPAGTNLKVELDMFGSNDNLVNRVKPSNPRLSTSNTMRVLLGAPAATNAAGLAASQGIAAAGSAVLAATVLDVPRNVIAAWTTAATLTVTGKDEFGVTMTEQVVGATSFTGKKAFKTITSMVITGAAVTLFTAGWGNVIGLPVFLEGQGVILAEILNGGVAAAGTVVAGVSALATNATGDVRGTYAPASAPDGTKTYALVVTVDDATNLGVPQA